MGGASDRRPKSPCDHQALSGGVSPATEALWAGPTLRRREIPLGQRYVGSSRLKGRGNLPVSETSEG
jgi:hypothetical protein